MFPTTYIIVYLISNVMRYFSFYLFFESALPESENKYRYLDYMLFFALDSLVYLLFDTPIVNTAVGIISIFSFTLFYPTSFLKRILNTFFIFAIGIFSESIVLIIQHFTSFPLLGRTNYMSYTGVICSPLFLFFFALIYRNRHRKIHNESLPASYLISELIIPMAFIVVCEFLFTASAVPDWQLTFIVCFLFAVTIASYIMYEKQITYFVRKNESEVLETQINFYKNQLELIKDNNERIKRIEHDIKNHLVTLSSLTEADSQKKAHEYIASLQSELFTAEQRVDTGNPVIDGIINAKSTIAAENNTPLKLTIQIPSDCPMDDMDATILLGNLLDNAIENTSGEFSLSIRYANERLLIQCSNPYIGSRKSEGGFFHTSKQNPQLHGYGYKNMQHIVEKYNGSMEYDDHGGIFSMRIILLCF